MIHWLVANVWPTALHTLVASLIAAAVANLIVGPVRAEVRRLRRQQAAVNDALDPSTPGGIAPLTVAMTKIADELDMTTPNGLPEFLKELHAMMDQEREESIDVDEGVSGHGPHTKVPVRR